MPTLVLVVEDEPAIADSVAFALKAEGFDALVAGSGERALEVFEGAKPDLVILDLMLPGMDGVSVCRVLRRQSAVPIIMLTARTAEVDRVVGLEVGADDYVTKPFGMRELIARARAALRRSAMAQQPAQELGFGDGWLSVNFDEPAVRVGGSEVQTSPRELSLLRALLSHRGRARTRAQLLEDAWGDDKFVTPRTVDVHVRWLRQKIEPDPAHPQYIETVRGIGYRFRR